MSSNNSISVRDLFKSDHLQTREQAEVLYSTVIKKLSGRDEYYIDFSNIDFVSRSFADELVHLAIADKKEDQIVFCCMSYTIERTFQSVKKTQIGNLISRSIPIRKFSNTESLLQYFSN